MAELLLKVGDSPQPNKYKDGDILCAFNQRYIRCVHAQCICDVRKTGYNGDGLRPESHARKFYELVYEYKFQRVSKDEFKRTDLLTREQLIIGKTPNAQGLHTNVELYLARRLKHAGHKIFGTKGNEFFYEGKKNFSNANLNRVWNMIETDTPNLEINHQLAPLGTEDKKVYLALKINDFTEAERHDFTEIEFGAVGQGQVVKKMRRRHIDWQSLSLPESKKNIQDMAKSIDIRESALILDKTSHIQTKPLSLGL